MAREYTNCDILEIRKLTREAEQRLAEAEFGLRAARGALLAAEMRAAEAGTAATQADSLHREAVAENTLLRASRSWRFTRPFRAVGHLLRGHAGVVLLGLGMARDRVERLARVAGTDGSTPKRAARLMVYAAGRAATRVLPAVARRSGRSALIRWSWLRNHYRVYLSRALAVEFGQQPRDLANDRARSDGRARYGLHRHPSGKNSNTEANDRLADWLTKAIGAIVEQRGINSVIEFGCGSGTQLTALDDPAYIGFDVATECIEIGRSRCDGKTAVALRDISQYRYQRADLTLSLDVISCLVDDHAFYTYMRRLFFASSQCVVVYSPNHRGDQLARQVDERDPQYWAERYHADFALVEGPVDQCPLTSGDQTGSTSGFCVFERLPTKRHWLPGRLVVSVTSYRNRFPTLELTLRRILHQSVLPDDTVLWISPQDSAHLPEGVTELQKSGLTIQIAKDVGPYTKIIPALKRCANSFIITLDDDQNYPRDAIEDLITKYRSPTEILCRRAHEVQFGPDGRPLPYVQWRHEAQEGHDRRILFPTGVGGILYPPNALAPQVLDETRFKQLSPFNDDIWLFWMGWLAGSTVRLIGRSWHPVMWTGADEEQLHYTNNDGGRNDQAIAAMTAYYGSPFRQFKKADGWIENNSQAGPGIIVQG